MTQPLTTSKAVARHYGQFASIQSVRVPSPLNSLAWLLICTFLVLVAGLYFIPWVQTTSGFGQVTALDPRDREQEINALVSGRIQQWFVRDGSEVKAGDPILRLVDNDPNLVERLNAERDALEQQLVAAQSAMQTAELDYERKKRLFEDGLSSRLDFETARIKLDDLRARVAAAEAALNRADVSLSRQSILEVKAPRDGTILKVNAGDTSTFIREGQSVATFLPHAVERAVELYIDGRDISLVEEGRKVRVQFEGWPAVQFSGWPSVAIGTFGGVVSFVDPSASRNGLFRVLVTPDPDDRVDWPEERFIRFGSNARGWILLDRVRLGYELWRQLNNFPPNFSNGTNAQSDPA